MRVLVTGAAGFVGFHVASALVSRGDSVVGVDNLNGYYDPALKRARLARLDSRAASAPGDFEFIKSDVADRSAIEEVFRTSAFDRVVHLAAQAGIRHSIERPDAFVQSNLVGFGNVLEACRAARTPHFVFASSSSVYGASAALPYAESDVAAHPIQLYAATKRANELMAHSYAHLYGLPATALRYFTAYGPWGRPDMALFAFTRGIIDGSPITLSNHGKHRRDFTFIDDAVSATLMVLDDVPTGSPEWRAEHADPATASAPFDIFNIGSGRPVTLAEFVETIELAVGRKAETVLRDRSPADMVDTHADISRITNKFGFAPRVELADGVREFVAWYRRYHAV